MSKMIETTGKTIEEAIRRGVDELKVSRDEVKIDVLEEPTSGMFGILSSKPAKVRLTLVRIVNPEMLDSTKEKANEILKNILGKINISTEIEEKVEDNTIFFSINNEDVGSILIGYKGETLEALQLLLNNILINKFEESVPKVVIDICGYRERKKKNLVELANKMAGNVKKFKKPIKLEPMSAYDRKVIHTVLQNHPYVKTESQGQEPRRRVVISLK